MDINNYYDPRIMNLDRGLARFDTFPNSNSFRGRQIPIPFYKMYQMPAMYAKVEDEERDMDRMKDMYSLACREVQGYVNEECDKMEYDGSLMFDEYPDKIMVRRICMNIYEKVKHLYDVEEDDYRDDVLAMSRHPKPSHGRRNWMNEVIEVMLINEMFRRRCRRRDCRTW